MFRTLVLWVFGSIFWLLPSLAQANADEARWDKGRWIERASLALLAGHEVPIEPLLGLSREQIIDQLMDRPEFADTILDFNLYHLGFKPDRIRLPDGSLNPRIFDSPGALASARAFEQNGDYFSLFDFEQPLYLDRLKDPEPGDRKAYQNLSPAKLRQRLFRKIQRELDQTISKIRSGSLDRDLYCGGLLKQISDRWGETGIPYSLAVWLARAEGWYGDLSRDCRVAPAAKLIERIEQVKSVNAKFIARLAAFEPGEPEAYHPTALEGLRAIDLRSLGVKTPWIPFTYELSYFMPSSFSNYNRRRAAYVLNRYFCDELSPIAKTVSKIHSQDKHASDPACRSCHYKLDPMAGFFKNYGLFFIDYSSFPTITFDDNSILGREQYESQWKDSRGAWQIGYIRSLEHPEKNDTGSSLPDLFSIMRGAPETKSCLVRRMLQYFVSEEQAFDGDYEEWLARDFAETARKSGSSQALRATLKKILLSESFAQTGLVDQCHDFAPGSRPDLALPCRVAVAIRKNCIDCHSSRQARGGLDLTHWNAEALRRVERNLASSDFSARMPPDRNMSDRDRDIIYRWASETLRTQAGDPR